MHFVLDGSVPSRFYSDDLNYFEFPNRLVFRIFFHLWAVAVTAEVEIGFINSIAAIIATAPIISTVPGI